MNKADRLGVRIEHRRCGRFIHTTYDAGNTVSASRDRWCSREAGWLHTTRPGMKIARRGHETLIFRIWTTR